MSIGTERGASEPGGRLRAAARLGTRLAVPAAVAFSLLIVLLSERAGVEHELRLTLPSVAPPGGVLPVRALLYGDLERPRGPILMQRPVRVALLDASGRRFTSTRLQPSSLGDMEGRLRLPKGQHGPATIYAETRADGRRVSVEASLRIEEPRSQAVAEPRAASALQRLAEGPLRVTSQAPAPSAMHLRVVGGACVPEQRCELLVWVGEPAARIRLAPHPSVTVFDEPGMTSEATDGIARLTVVTHGPEAVARLQALRDDEVVARRRVQLPVALGASAMTMPHGPFPRDEPSPVVRLEPSVRGFVVDAFRDGRWARTGSLPASGGSLPFFSSLAPGVWRLQARRDPYGGVGSAAVRMLYVQPPGQEPEATLRTIARHVAGRVPDAPLASRVARHPSRFLDWELSPLVRYMWAPLEARLYALPPSIGSYDADVQRLRDHRRRLRWLAWMTLAAAGLAFLAHLMRRGLEASAEARRILGSAGDPTAHSRRTRWRMTWTVVLSALALLLAFVAIGLYVSARSLLMPQ